MSRPDPGGTFGATTSGFAVASIEPCHRLPDERNAKHLEQCVDTGGRPVASGSKIPLAPDLELPGPVKESEPERQGYETRYSSYRREHHVRHDCEHGDSERGDLDAGTEQN